MWIVLDTGVLIAALITRDTPPDQIYQAWREKRFGLITSEWQLDEFQRVSRYPKLRKFLKPSESGNMINGLRHQARVLAELPKLDESRDPHDNPLLAMAVAGQADYLVSGDKRDVLTLKKIRTTRIVTARRFLNLLEGKKR
ncbi:MAG: putative toxin-antitoxin system toxin component, PIN family [Gammaproteobacteria bacterium]|nr:putative toxin-antitoxin system toxin component, PIN family [Gammaproteobacteria bacterium]